MKSAEIISLLRARHSTEIFIEELRAGSGYGGDSESRIDAWSLHPYPSKCNVRTAYEVKISRSDFVRDVKKVGKHRAAQNASNEFYFVAPAGIIKPSELPPFAGLLEVCEREGLTLVDIVPAPWRDTCPPSWRFVASLCRNISKAKA